MLLPNETQVALSPDLAVADLGDEAVILDPASGTYFGLNEVASRILALAREETTVGEIVDRLIDEFEVDRSILAADVTAFVQDLARRGMIRIG